MLASDMRRKERLIVPRPWGDPTAMSSAPASSSAPAEPSDMPVFHEDGRVVATGHRALLALAEHRGMIRRNTTSVASDG